MEHSVKVFLLFLLPITLFATNEKPVEKPVPLYRAAKVVGSYDPSTGAVSYDKDADPKEVVLWLIQEAQKIGLAAQQAQKELASCESSKTKKP
jgi:hypothetical protein